MIRAERMVRNLNERQAGQLREALSNRASGSSEFVFSAVHRWLEICGALLGWDAENSFLYHSETHAKLIENIMFFCWRVCIWLSYKLDALWIGRGGNLSVALYVFVPVLRERAAVLRVSGQQNNDWEERTQYAFANNLRICPRGFAEFMFADRIWSEFFCSECFGLQQHWSHLFRKCHFRCGGTSLFHCLITDMAVFW